MARERVYRIVERKVKRGGKTVTLIYARSSYTDRQGNRHTLWRAGENPTEAKNRLRDALDDALRFSDEYQESARTTFNDLAEYYKARYVIPAKYKGDLKIEGLRSHKQVASQMKPLIDYFGLMKLRRITHEDIRLYKVERLSTPYEKGKDAKGKPIEHERAVASVNRELALLRKMLNVAKGQRWILTNPFNEGESLISLAGEVERQRIMNDDEEGEIFKACGLDGRRAHLQTILICLIDTGMRRNEAFRLTWSDLDFDENILWATSFKGKMRFRRPIGMTARLRTALLELRDNSRAKPDDLVFGITGDIKRSWATVRRLANLQDVRLHDLRHQAATNFIKSGLSLEETGKLLGHKEPKTTWRYVNINAETAQRAASGVDKMRGKKKG